MAATRDTGRQLTSEERLAAGRYLRSEATLVQLAAEHGASRQQVRQWVLVVDPEARRTVAAMRRVLGVEAQALRTDIEQARALVSGYRCRVCLGPSVRSVDTKRFVTCSRPCSQLWAKVRYQLDTEYRARHQHTIARWTLANADTLPPERCRAAERSLADTAVQRGRWTVSGSSVEAALAQVSVLRAATQRRWGEPSAPETSQR